jgi:hypothetical protein
MYKEQIGFSDSGQFIAYPTIDDVGHEVCPISDCKPRINRALCSIIYMGTSERNSECKKESYDKYCNFSWLVA